MRRFSTIREYYKEFGHTPPKVDYFDVRPFEQYKLEAASPKKTYTTEPFQVEFYGIGLVLQGTAERYMGGKFSANLVFYTPYQILSWSKVDNNWKGYYLMFDQDFLSRCHFAGNFLADFPFLRLDTVHPIKISEPQVTDLYPLFENIHREFIGGRNDRFYLIESYVRIILHLIKRFTSKEHAIDADSTSSTEINLVSRYTLLVEKRLAEKTKRKEYFSPAYYGKQLNIHPNHLNAIIKRVTKKTAKQLILESVMVYAKALLSQSSFTVKEIAFQLGFEDPSHFSNSFKKHIGSTPAVYRSSVKR